MAPIEHTEVDEHPGGLVDKVRYKVGATHFSGGLAWVFPVCEDCGAMLADQRRHDAFHDRIGETDE